MLAWTEIALFIGTLQAFGPNLGLAWTKLLVFFFIHIVGDFGAILGLIWTKLAHFFCTLRGNGSF